MAVPGNFLSLRTPRIVRSALWSAGLITLWLVAQIVIDRCWLYVHGAGSVSKMAALAFVWLWVLLVLTWRGRIGFITLTLLLAAVTWPGERIRVAAAESRAASVLRSSAQRLEEAASDRYPASANAAVFGDDLPGRFYRFEYVQQHSSENGTINGFLLKARPVRYDCGCTTSFLAASGGKIHTTRENREATLKDPALD